MGSKIKKETRKRTERLIKNAQKRGSMEYNHCLWKDWILYSSKILIKWPLEYDSSFKISSSNDKNASIFIPRNEYN